MKLLWLLVFPSLIDAFSNTLFQDQVVNQKLAPSKTDGVDIELPDFEELFGRMQNVSPLARTVISGSPNGKKGFAASSTCKSSAHLSQGNP